jgi:hypothetical protein
MGCGRRDPTIQFRGGRKAGNLRPKIVEKAQRCFTSSSVLAPSLSLRQAQ